MNIKLKAFLFSFIRIFIPYGLFLASVAMIIITGLSNMDTNSALILLSLVALILLVIGGAILRPSSITIETVANIRTPRGSYEIIKLGDDRYSIQERGSSGAGLAYLHFLFNFLISPFMLIIWILKVFLILCKNDYAEKYIENSESIIKRELIGMIFIIIAFVAVGIELIFTPNILSSIKKENIKNYEASEIHLSISSLEHEGFNGYNYVSTLRIIVQNDCDVGLTILSGSLQIENYNNHNTLWNGKFDLDLNIKPNGGTSISELILRSTQNNLCQYTLDELNIFIKIEFAQFSDYVNKNYTDGEFVKIHIDKSYL